MRWRRRCWRALRFGWATAPAGQLTAEAAAAWPAGTDAERLNRMQESLRETLDAFAGSGDPAGGHLTPAEIRVLRLLPTHLTFRQIGERLFLSRNTVKTEAISAGRKLRVSSRSEAVQRAQQLKLL